MYLNEDQILIDAAVKSNGNGNYLENKYIINIKIPIKKTQNWFQNSGSKILISGPESVSVIQSNISHRNIYHLPKMSNYIFYNPFNTALQIH